MLNYPIINIISHNWEELCCDAIGLKTNFCRKKYKSAKQHHDLSISQKNRWRRWHRPPKYAQTRKDVVTTWDVSVYLQLYVHRIHFTLPQHIEVTDKRQPQLEELVWRALVQRARLRNVLEIDQRIVEYLFAGHEAADVRIDASHSDANEFGRFRLEWLKIWCGRCSDYRAHHHLIIYSVRWEFKGNEKQKLLVLSLKVWRNW